MTAAQMTPEQLVSFIQQQTTATAGEAQKVYDQLIATGNITNTNGQIAVGANITQLTINILTQERARAALPAAQSVPNPRYVLGRDPDLTRLAEACGTKSALVLSGFPGIGKTTLLATFLNRQRSSAAADAPAIHWYQLRDELAETDLPLAFQRFVETYATRYKLDYDPLANPTETDKLNWLLGELEKRPGIVGLDNIDGLLDQANRPRSEGWKALFEAAAAGLPGTSTLLLTGATVPVSLDTLSMQGLDEANAVALLRHELGDLADQTDAELLRQAVDAEHTAGNPIAIVQLARYVRRGTSLADALQASFWLQDAELVIEHLFGTNWARLSEQEHRFLTYLSIFPGFVAAEVISGVASRIPGATAWSKADVQRVAAELIDQSVVETLDNRYRLYPLVRAAAAKQLKKPKAAHSAATKYYQSLYKHSPTNPPRVLADVQPLIDAHYHLCAMGNYRAALELLLSPIERRTHQTAAGLPDAAEQITLTARLKSWGQHALVAQLWGRLRDGLDHFPDEVLESAGRIVFENLLDAYRTLGADYHRLGNWKAAIRTKVMALEASRRIRDMTAEANMLERLANTYLASGDHAAALTYFLRARDKNAAIGDAWGQERATAAIAALKQSVGEETFTQLLAEISPELAADGIMVNPALFSDIKVRRLSRSTVREQITGDNIMNTGGQVAIGNNMNIGGQVAIGGGVTQNTNRLIDIMKSKLESGDMDTLALVMGDYGFTFDPGTLPAELPEQVNALIKLCRTNKAITALVRSLIDRDAIDSERAAWQEWAEDLDKSA
jgi:tetratricopeptide (TPR) repeat protein